MKTLTWLTAVAVAALAVWVWDVSDRQQRLHKEVRDLKSRELYRHFTRNWQGNN